MGRLSFTLQLSPLLSYASSALQYVPGEHTTHESPSDLYPLSHTQDVDFATPVTGSNGTTLLYGQINRGRY